MSINDIYDAIEHQDVWASWRVAEQDNIRQEAAMEKARRERERRLR